MKKLILLLLALTITTATYAGTDRFYNPVIPADFPDPDVTRLGDTYYFLSTTMCLMPGATVLKSTDLVNWEFCCNPLTNMSEADKYSLIDGQHSYAQGMWAGAIEAHDGRLYILLNCNDAGAFVLSTDDPEGQWQMQRLSRSYYDPGMIIEGDRIYIVCGINEIRICELDLDWNFLKETTVIRKNDSGLEGSHLYHIGDYYYIYSTYGGWPSGQTIFRSKNILGPYDEKMLMEKWLNGVPNTVHQGALMETSTGEWWTMLMEDKGAIGRMPSLHPVVWEDGWPTIAQKGKPQPYYDLPQICDEYPGTPLPTDDNFRSWQLGKQWQWNHNAPTGYWSLLDNPGNLRLYTSSVTNDFMLARGTLTQRIFAKHNTSSPYGLESKPSIGTICLDVSAMQPGDVAGIAVQQDPYAMLGVTLGDDGQYSLLWKSGSHTGTDNFTPGQKTKAIEPVDGKVYLRGKFNAVTSEATFQYSLDGNKWTGVGNKTTLRFNLSVFVGARWALFNYATKSLGGHVDIDWFCAQDDVDLSVLEPAGFEGYGDDILAVESLALAGGKQSLELMVGSPRDIKLIATYRNGRTEDISARAAYTAEWPELLEITGGRIKGTREGKTMLKARYTDALGNVAEKEFEVSSAYFPFDEAFIKNIWDTNTYDPETRRFKTAAYGQMGWEYDHAVDMSEYRYLVLTLDEPQNCDADIRLYAQPSIWGGSSFIQKLGNNTEIVLDLREITYTDGDAKGEPVNVANIHKVGFWSNGRGVIDVADMYLTRRKDHKRETGMESDDELIINPLYSVKSANSNNPISPFNFCADPTALEYDGRVYVYGTNDQQQFDATGFAESNSYGKINTLVCMSSADLVNWTWHAPIEVKKIAPWTDCSWAPSVCSRTDAEGNTSFYLYFANAANGIGVLKADTPTGPWQDPLGKVFIGHGHPGMGQVRWLFDPGVVVDENGTGWLSWGGGDGPTDSGDKLIDGNTRIARLGDDMVSIDSDIVVLPAPYHFEASELNIIGGKFVYTYCSNWDSDRSQWNKFEYYDHSQPKPDAPGVAKMCYMTSTDPLNAESWQYEGEYVDNPGGNNHTHLQKVGNSYYLFYHNEKLSTAINGQGRGYRSINVNKAQVDEKACKISKVSMTDGGASQIRDRRPVLTDLQEAEMVWNCAGIDFITTNSDMAWVAPQQPGAWTAVKQTTAKDELHSFAATLRGKGRLEVRLNSVDAKPVAVVTFDSEKFQEYSVNIEEPFKGGNTVYFVFSEIDRNSEVAFDDWQFFETESYVISAPTDLTIVNQEYYTVSGIRLERPVKGINIVKTTYADGTVRSRKVIVK